jgi:hypothetical protein
MGPVTLGSSMDDGRQHMAQDAAVTLIRWLGECVLAAQERWPQTPVFVTGCGKPRKRDNGGPDRLKGGLGRGRVGMTDNVALQEWLFGLVREMYE